MIGDWFVKALILQYLLAAGAYAFQGAMTRWLWILLLVFVEGCVGSTTPAPPHVQDGTYYANGKIYEVFVWNGPFRCIDGILYHRFLTGEWHPMTHVTEAIGCPKELAQP